MTPSTSSHREGAGPVLSDSAYAAMRVIIPASDAEVSSKRRWRAPRRDVSRLPHAGAITGGELPAPWSTVERHLSGPRLCGAPLIWVSMSPEEVGGMLYPRGLD